MAEIKHLIETDYKGNYNNMGERIEAIEKEVHDSSYMKLTNENVRSFQVGKDSNGISTAMDSTNSAMGLEGQTLVNIIEQDVMLFHNYPRFNVSEDFWLSYKEAPMYLDFIYNKKTMLKPSTKYTMVLEVKENTLANPITYNSPNTVALIPTSSQRTLFSTGETGIKTVLLQSRSTQEEIDNSLYVFFVACSQAEVVTRGVATLRVSLYEGDHTNKPIEYFKDLQSVGEETVLPLGKNMFGKHLLQDGNISGGINIGSEISGNYKRTDFIPVKKNTNYAISMKNTGTFFLEKKMFYDENKNYLHHNAIRGDRVINSGEGAYLRVVFGTESTETFDHSVLLNQLVQIEESSVITDYEEYKGEPVTKHKIEISSIGKNLYDIKNAYVQNVGGNYESYGTTTKTDDVITHVTGTTSYGVNLGDMQLKPNTTYTITLESDFDAHVTHKTGLRYHNLSTDGYSTPTSTNSLTFTTDKYGKYQFLYYFGMYHTEVGRTYRIWNIQIEEGAVATDYEEYKSNKTEILLNEPLRSLPSGIADTVEIKDGKLIVTRNCKEVVLKGEDSEGWGIYPRNSEITFVDTIAFISGDIGVISSHSEDIVCDKFSAKNVHTFDEEGAFTKSTARIGIKKNKLQTENVAGFKLWLSENPVKIVGQLATPTIEEYDLLNPILYKDGHVFLETGAIPCSSVSHEVALNTKAQVKNNSKAIASSRNIYDEMLGEYDGMLLELDYDHTVFDFEYNISKLKLEEV